MFTSLEGNVFTAKHRLEGQAANATTNITFKVPTMLLGGKQIHLYVIGSVSGADFAGGDISVLENPTITPGTGVELTVQNINREAARANFKSMVTDEDDVSNAVSTGAAIADGTAIWGEDTGQGNSAKSLLDLKCPLVLTANQDYSVVMTSDTADTTLSLTLVWQEIEKV